MKNSTRIVSEVNPVTTEIVTKHALQLSTTEKWMAIPFPTSLKLCSVLFKFRVSVGIVIFCFFITRKRRNS